MADVSPHAPRCAGCGPITVPPTDPVSILERLPERLFNRTRPIPADEATFDDIVLDETQFGPVGGTEPTPQYELARIFAEAKDGFRERWLRAVALQHGAGLMSVTPDGVTCQCPRAEGPDLDRVGEQYGIGRPLGFTDCCYWRLILLLLFKPGTTVWLIRELAELYTGVRPGVLEEPAKLTLRWPVSGGASFFGRRSTVDGGGWFFGQNAYFNGDAVFTPPNAHYGYWSSGTTNPPPGPVGSYWASVRSRASGLLLEDAIGLVKAAGIFVHYVNRRRAGVGGCYGATLRGEARGIYWA